MGMQHIIAWYVQLSVIREIGLIFVLIARYQKKIGNYDEGKWEKSLEHRDKYTFSPVDLKSGELKTGLIDLDLVRGMCDTKRKFLNHKRRFM